MAHPDEGLANLGSFLEHSAASRPGHPAIRLDDFVRSYAELRGAAGRMSTLLTAAGVEALTCRPPTLEELFLRHYSAERAGPGATP